MSAEVISDLSATTDLAYSKAVLTQLNKQKPVEKRLVEKGFRSLLLTRPELQDSGLQEYLKYFDGDQIYLSKMLDIALQTEQYSIFKLLIMHGAEPQRHSHSLLRLAAIQMTSAEALAFVLQNGLQAEDDGWQTFNFCIQENLREMLRVFIFEAVSAETMLLHGLERSLEAKNLDLSEYLIALCGGTKVPKQFREKYIALVMTSKST